MWRPPRGLTPGWTPGGGPHGARSQVPRGRAHVSACHGPAHAPPARRRRHAGMAHRRPQGRRGAGRRRLRPSFETAPIGTGQMADTTRFSLTYDEPGAGPATVVGKFASADDQSRGHRPGAAGLRNRGALLPGGGRPCRLPAPGDLRGRGGARDRLVHAADRGHRRRGPGGPDRGLQPRRGGGRPRGDGRPPRPVLGGARAGRARVAQPLHAGVGRLPGRLVSRCSPASWSATPTPWRPSTGRSAASSPSISPPTSGCGLAPAPPATATSASTTSCSSRATRGRWWWTGRPRPGAVPPSTWPTSSAAASAPRTGGPTSPTCWPIITTRSAAGAYATTRWSSCAPTPAATPSPAS